MSEPGPLARLLAGLGVDAHLAPIPTVKRIEVMPVTVGVPVGRDTPEDCRCPCGIFEKEAHAELCPKCTLKQANRQRAEREKLSRAESIDRELAARKAPKIYSGPFEPDDYGTPRRTDDPDEQP